MNSTKQKTHNPQLPGKGKGRIFGKSRNWLAVFISAIMFCTVAAVPLAAQKNRTPPRFVDNGDGTVTDSQTGLMWEKKTEGNVNNVYSWSSALFVSAPDGTLFTDFLPKMTCTISSDGTCGLAGHYDWRVPNISELQTILDCSKPNCTDPIFGPIAASQYWSASTSALDSGGAWWVNFSDGNVSGSAKASSHHIRAVRGGK